LFIKKSIFFYQIVSGQLKILFEAMVSRKSEGQRPVGKGCAVGREAGPMVEVQNLFPDLKNEVLFR
jgi:hypothetical protein